MNDLIIIGGGPAAVSAGIYSARKKLKTLLISKGWGGQLNYAPLIENYPGIKEILGIDLVKKMTEHLKSNNLEIVENREVKGVELISDQEVRILTPDQEYMGKALIIASGRVPRKLGIPGEEKFIGKGISFCATCDAPLFQDKEVAVVGGGNAGFGIALELFDYASKIYILEATEEVCADESLQEKINKIDKIGIITKAKVSEIKGDDFVNGLIYSNGTAGKERELPVKGIFLAIGSVANSSFLKNMVELNKQGEIKIDACNKTSQPNIFAAGDVTNVSHKQVIIAAGEGAKAALNAYEYIKNN